MGRREPCEGIGQPAADSVVYAAATCPVCRGIRAVDNGLMDYHEVVVLLDEDEDEDEDACPSVRGKRTCCYGAGHEARSGMPCRYVLGD